jgi:4-hydroxy-tetrahydrodipicolinate synthase
VSSQFTGVIVPMVTPLTADERLDRPALKRLVEYVIQGGVDGIFILGSIGEGPMLRPAVRLELAEATVEAAAGRVPVIAGALEPSTSRVIEEVRALAGRGLRGYVVTTPFYYGGYNAEDLSAHFRRVAEAADLPILLYNIPQNTKVAFGAELALKLAKVANVAGLKDSSGDWIEVQAILAAHRPPGFVVLQGNQTYAGISMLTGADGLVPGHANVYPQLLAELVASGRRGDVAATMACQARLDALMRLRGRAAIHTFKIVLKAMGLTGDTVCSPLPRLAPPEAEKFLAASVAAGLPLPCPKQS